MSWIFTKLLRTKFANQDIRLGNQNEFSGVISPTKPIAITNEPVEFTGEVTGIPDSRPYRVYTALLSQAGTDNVAAIVLENTLGSNMTWSRDSAGEYFVTFSGTENIFNDNNTTLVYDSYRNNIGFPVEKRLIRAYISEPKKIWLSTTDPDGVSAESDVLAYRFFEIRVYN